MKDLSFTKVLILVITSFSLLFGGIYFISKKHADFKADELFSQAKDFARKGDNFQALKYIDLAISYSKKYDYFYFKYKKLLAEGRGNEADFYLDKAIEINKKDPHNYVASSFLNARLRNFDKLISRLKTAIELEPRNSDYKFLLGSALIKFDRNYKEGINILKEVVKFDPKFKDAWIGLFAGYSLDGNNELAERTLKEAIGHFPNDPYFYYWLGRTCEKEGLIEEAVKAYKKSIELEPATGINAAHRIAELTGTSQESRYEQAREKAMKDYNEELPAKFDGGLIYVSCFVAGKPGTFILDTGATSTVLYDRFLKKNKLFPSGKTPVVEYVGVGGVFQAPVYYVDVDINGRKIRNIRAGVIPVIEKARYEDGIIGLDVLQFFKVEIDNSKKKVYLRL